ncbi:hypothetical protein Tco_0578777 [Tanacetum coccineum]
MRTRSSSNLVGNSSSNPTTSNPKRRNRRRSNQRVEPFALEESPIVTMADQRTMAELLRAPTEGYAEVCNSRNKLIVSQVKSSDGNSSSSDIAKLTHACLAADGNTFPEYRDNIQGYVAAAAGNYNQGNAGYRPPDDTTLPGDPRYPHIPYPSRMNQEKQKEKDEVQIHKFWQMFKKLHINISLADALILIPKYQKMLKSLLSNKEKLIELANTPLNENCSAVILKKLPEKLGDPGKFLIPCGFSKLKYKALANLAIHVPPLLGRPFLIDCCALIDVSLEKKWIPS